MSKPFLPRVVIASWISVGVAVAAIAAAARYANEVTVSESGGYRIVESNGIPDHPAGDFPNANNPNSIAPQDYTWRMPLNPAQAKSPTAVGMSAFGVALNGVPFDPAAAEWFGRDPGSGWQYEALSGFLNLGMDAHHAHVQPGGAYHYHGSPTGLIDARTSGEGMMLVGYAADGFPLYALYGHAEPNDLESPIVTLRSSYRLKQGVRPAGPGGSYDGTFVEDWEYVPGAGDLDECNGRTGVTPEFPDGTYYYVITETFPFIPRLWRGTPDPSFFKRGPGPGGRGGFPPPRGPEGHRPPPGHAPPPRN